MSLKGNSLRAGGKALRAVSKKGRVLDIECLRGHLLAVVNRNESGVFWLYTAIAERARPFLNQLEVVTVAVDDPAEAFLLESPLSAPGPVVVGCGCGVTADEWQAIHKDALSPETPIRRIDLRR